MRNAGFFGLVAVVAVIFAASHRQERWHPTALDGDTFVRAGTHYRLQGLDAPELPGHCGRGRHCAAGDPWASRRGLQAELSRGISCVEHGQDHYGRTLVRCQTAEGNDLSQTLINQGLAQPYSYKGR